MRITITKRNGILESPIDFRLMEQVRVMPGKKRWDSSTVPARLLFSPDEANISWLREQYPQAEWIDDTGTVDAIEALYAETKTGPEFRSTMPTDYRFKTKPYEHQLKVFNESKGRVDFALFLEAGCVDADTEYLSPEGWRKISEYIEGPVCQFDPKTGRAQFIEPEAFVKKPCDKFYHFQQNGLDQMLSEDHRMMIIYPRYDRKNKDEFINQWHEATPQYGERLWRGETTVKQLLERFPNEQIKTKLETTFFLEQESGLYLSDDLLRLQVAFHADGSYGTRDLSRITRRRKGLIRIKKERKKTRLREILAACNIPWAEKEVLPEGFTTFIFTPPIISKDYSDMIWWSTSQHQRNIIAEEAPHWDGSIKPGNRGAAFCSRHEHDADFIQFCFASTGRRASKRPSADRSLWTVLAAGPNSSQLALPRHPERVSSEDGFMYCFTVPTSALIFRRNGCIFVSGNTGKSKIMIDTASYLWSQGKIDGVLIVSPNGVHRQWLDEQVPAHMPDFVSRKKHAWKADKLTEDIFEKTADLRLLSMNFEALVTENGRAVAGRFLKSGRMLMIVDESHKIKNPSAKVTKACIALGRDAKFRRIATGTPVAKGLEDKFSQMFFLSPFILGFNSFYSFKNNYCVMGGFENRSVIGYRNVEQFQARILPHSARVTKKQCLDLPAKIGGIDNPDGILARYVELTPEQRRHYDAIKQEFITELRDGSVVEAPLAIQRIIRLQQVLCGHLPKEDGSVELIASNRVRVTQDIVEEAVGKVVIWTRFRHDVEVLRTAFGDRAVVVQGSQEKENKESIAAFTNKASGKDILIANQQSGGTGLNLVVQGIDDLFVDGRPVSTVIYYANSFNSIDRWQSEERTYRIGTQYPVTYYDLISRGTIDTSIVSNLRRKKNIASLSLGELEAMLS